MSWLYLKPGCKLTKLLFPRCLDIRHTYYVSFVQGCAIKLWRAHFLDTCLACSRPYSCLYAAHDVVERVANNTGCPLSPCSHSFDLSPVHLFNFLTLTPMPLSLSSFSSPPFPMYTLTDLKLPHENSFLLIDLSRRTHPQRLTVFHHLCAALFSTQVVSLRGKFPFSKGFTTYLSFIAALSFESNLSRPTRPRFHTLCKTS